LLLDWKNRKYYRQQVATLDGKMPGVRDQAPCFSIFRRLNRIFPVKIATPRGMKYNYLTAESRQRWQVKMTRLLIFLVLIFVPCTVLADCIITDTPYKFEVVCSGYNPMSPPTESKKNKKIAKRSNKAKKVTYEGRESVTPAVVMNVEESQFMQTRNQQDGYRGKRKPREQPTKKTGAGQNNNTGNSGRTSANS